MFHLPSTNLGRNQDGVIARLFPVIYGRKNLGIIPEVFVKELLGNDARTLRERFLFWIDMFLICQQQLLCFVH